MLLSNEQQIETVRRLRAHSERIIQIGYELEMIVARATMSDALLGAVASYKEISTRHVLILDEILHCAERNIGVPESEQELVRLEALADSVVRALLDVVKLVGAPS